MSYERVSKALQQAYDDGNDSATGNRPGSLWDWTKPIGLQRKGPSSIALQPLVGHPEDEGMATLSEIEWDPSNPATEAPVDRDDASKEDGWYLELKKATPERNKHYPAKVITNDGKIIFGTVHWKDIYSRIWLPNKFVDLASNQ